MNHYQAEVVAYFSRKAADYDAVDEQPYWRLSDEILWWLLEETVLARLPDGARALDAGGGTGRWSIRLLRARPDVEVTLFDLSSDMVDIAARKARRLGLADRLEIIEGDLDQVGSLLSAERFDLVTCFHNVLGFVPSPSSVIASLRRLLGPSGQMALVVPNRYHTAYFNLKTGHIEDAARALVEGRGRFTTDMPEIDLFTPQDLEGFCAANDLNVELLTGFPVLIYPGHQETQLFGSTRSLADLLSEPLTFDRILQLERRAARQPGVAARGNNLFLAAHAGG